MVTPMFGFSRAATSATPTSGWGTRTAPTGADRLYITRSWRATAGVRVVVNQHIVAKAEYLRNGEYDGIPAIPDDIFTTSLVLSY